MLLSVPTPRRFARWLPLVVATLALVAYLTSFPGAFFFDDNTLISDNQVLSEFHLKTIFTSDYWGTDVNSGLYRPMTILSLALNQALLGKSAVGFHFVNVLLHLSASVLFGYFLVSFGVEWLLAWLAAALFAVHPIHVDVINMAVGRSELLVAVFLFAAGWLSRREQWSNRIAVACSYALALLSKEHAIVFLALLPALDAFFADQRPLTRWRQRLPLYALLAVITLAWFAFRSWGVVRLGLPRDAFDPDFMPFAFLPTGIRLLTACKMQLLYGYKLLVPTGLQPIYSGDNFFQPVQGLLSFWGGTVIVALITLCLALWYGWGRRSLAGLALLLYLISFSPTANIFFVTGVTFADRLAYLPSAWFCLGLIALWFELRECNLRWGMLGGITVMLCVFCLMTSLRNRDYRNPLTLWTATVTTDPQNVLAWTLLGNAYYDAGDFRLAEKSYTRALELSPDFVDGLNAYAHLLYAQERYEEAAARSKRAIDVAVSPFTSAYIQYAKAMMQLGNWKEMLNAAEKIPDHIKRIGPIYWELRGRALEGLGDKRGALAAYQQEYTMQPSRDSDVLQRLGTLLVSMEQYAQAEDFYRSALAKVENAAAWNGLGVALGLQGRQGEAVPAFANAVRLNPASFEYRRNYEFALKSSSKNP